VPYDQGLAPHRHHEGMQRESATEPHVQQPTTDNEKPHFTHMFHHDPENPI